MPGSPLHPLRRGEQPIRAIAVKTHGGGEPYLIYNTRYRVARITCLVAEWCSFNHCPQVRTVPLYTGREGACR